MASESELPIDSMRRVIDFSVFGVDKVDRQLQREHFDRVARQMWDGFAADGFVYLKNHGIDDTKIVRIFEAADSFFDLPLDVKNKYRIRKGINADDLHGYIPFDAERLDNIELMEHRESFMVTTTKLRLPETDSRGFTVAVDQFFRSCSLLALRVLKTIAIALKLEEDYFTKIHLPMDTLDNYTCMRMINYPPLTPKDVHKSAVRCGEHSDYGSLTLLFQDESGGLEAKIRSGEYVHITPIPGTVVVNIGNILEHMTSGRLLSVKHRVVLKDDDTEGRKKRRRAVAFFVHPVHEALVQRLTGPQDPNPSNSQDFVTPHVESTYVI